MPKKHSHSSRFEAKPKSRGIESFIGKTAVVAAVGVVAGVLAISQKAEALQPSITERPHREYEMKKSTERLWGIGQRAYPGMDPRESSYEIAHDQPEGFDAGAMQVGDTLYLEPDAKIGEYIDPENSAGSDG